MKTHRLTGLGAAKQVSEAIEVLQERIRIRAYEIFVQRGREDGHELDDWLQAEAEQTGNKAKAMAA